MERDCRLADSERGSSGTFDGRVVRVGCGCCAWVHGPVVAEEMWEGWRGRRRAVGRLSTSRRASDDYQRRRSREDPVKCYDIRGRSH